MLILVLVLRYTITMLRDLGLASVLPLDNNIYFHKLVGRLIFVQAWVHAIMHFINFGQSDLHNCGLMFRPLFEGVISWKYLFNTHLTGKPINFPVKFK